MIWVNRYRKKRERKSGQTMGRSREPTRLDLMRDQVRYQPTYFRRAAMSRCIRGDLAAATWIARGDERGDAAAGFPLYLERG